MNGNGRMNIKWLFLLSVFVSICSNAAVYRSVDTTGNVSYSDQPKAGSKQLEIEVALPSTPYQPSSTNMNDNVLEVPDSAMTKPVDVPVYSLTIISPSADEGVRNNEGNLTVALALSPTLNKDRQDSFEIKVDGNSYGNKQTSTHFVVENLIRGTHSLSVSVVDASGSVLTNKQTTFHILRK